MRGIGRAAAVAFARLGADVVITGTGRDPSTFPDDEKAMNWRDIESTAEEVRSHGVRALPLVADARNIEDAQNTVLKAVEEFGRVDILVNNAAAARGADRAPLLDLDPEVFQRVLDIKVTGTYLMTKSFVEQVVAQGHDGKIVNISSTAGKRGSAHTLAYNAANFAIVGMTQGLARELGPMGINVNCVCPGAVDTHRNGRPRSWQAVAANGRTHANRPQRHRPRGRRLHRLPLHRGSVVDPRPVDQHQRRHDGGALAPHLRLTQRP